MGMAVSVHGLRPSTRYRFASGFAPVGATRHVNRPSLPSQGGHPPRVAAPAPPYPTWTPASSSEPLKYSEPGRAPIGTASVFPIDPMLKAFEND